MMIYGLSNTKTFEVNNAIVIRIQRQNNENKPHRFLNGVCKNIK